MLDSHCHLDDPRYDADIDGVEARRRAAGVRVLVPGVDVRTGERLRERATEAGWLYALGTHPEHLDAHRAPEDCAPSDVRGAAAVGECGLHRPSPVPMERQVAVLEAHLARAREAGLPVVLHCVRAHDVLPAVLRRHGGARGVLHSYSGGAALVPIYTGLGLHLGFGGALTWAGARRPVEAMRRTPLERLLVESDGPDQRPRLPGWTAPWSEPAAVPAIARRMAELRGVDEHTLRAALDASARELGWAA